MGPSDSTKSASTPGQNVPAQPSAQLSAYLGANQAQAGRFGENVAGKLAGDVSATQGAIAGAPDVYAGNLYTVGTDKGLNEQLQKSPSSLTPEQQEAYKKQLGAASKAPNSANTFETTGQYQDLAGQIQKNTEQAGLWSQGNNLPALKTALSPYEGTRATAGDRSLDALLLSRTPGAYGQIKEAVAPAANLQGQLDAGTAEANKSLNNAIQQDMATTAAAQEAARGYSTSLSQYLTNAVKENQAKQNAQMELNNRLNMNANAGNLTAEDVAALGIPPEQALNFMVAFNGINPAISGLNSAYETHQWDMPGGRMDPVNLANYIKQGQAKNINPATVANEANFKDISALEGLLGPNSSVNLPIASSDASLAGTGLGGSAASWNPQGLESVLSRAEQIPGSYNLTSWLKELLGQTSPANPGGASGGFRTT